MSYGLERVASRRSPIYRQLTNYYEYCSQVCAMSPQTMTSKVHHINDFIKFTRLTSLTKITNQQIYNWIEEQKSRGNSGRTINNRLAQLKVMLRWERDDNVAMRKLQLSRIAMQKELPPRKNYFTRSEIQKVLLYADLRTWLMIKLSFDCGLRIGELVGIRLADIYDNKLRIVGKGQKLRWVILSPPVQEKINQWVKQQKIQNWLWPNLLNDYHISTDEARQAMKKTFREAGFTDFRPHDLRHSYATDLKKLGLPTRKIQMAMGHASESTTERYLSDLDGINIEEIYRVKYGE